jgi:hypothetical protein
MQQWSRSVSSSASSHSASSHSAPDEVQETRPSWKHSTTCSSYFRHDSSAAAFLQPPSTSSIVQISLHPRLTCHLEIRQTRNGLIALPSGRWRTWISVPNSALPSVLDAEKRLIKISGSCMRILGRKQFLFPSTREGVDVDARSKARGMGNVTHEGLKHRIMSSDPWDVRTVDRCKYRCVHIISLDMDGGLPPKFAYTVVGSECKIVCTMKET